MPYDLDTLLKVITRRARLLIGVDMSYISYTDEEEGYVYVRTSDGHTSRLSVGLRLRTGEGLGSSVLGNPSPFWTADYLSDSRISHSEDIDEVVRAEGLHAIMGVPLSHRNRPFGVLYVADRNLRQFSTDEIALMSSLGDLAGVAIEKAQLLDQASATVSTLEQHTSEAVQDLRLTHRLNELHSLLIDSALSGGDPVALAAEVEHPAGRRGPGLHRQRDAARRRRRDAGLLEGAVVAASMDAHAASRPVLLDDGTWVASISAGTVVLGTLFLQTGPPLADLGTDAARAVAQVLAIPLLLEHERSAVAAGHVHDELLDELLATPQRPAQQLVLRARRLGIDLVTPHVLVVARPEKAAHAKVATWAALYAHRNSGLKRVQNGMAVLLLPGTDPSAAAKAVLDELTPLLRHPVTVTAAGPTSDPTSVFHGHQEALRCLDAMTSLGATGRSASVGELGFFGVLLADNHDVDGFVASAIGPVLDYDQQRLTELARTLTAYFETGNSPTYAAQRLHVHTNTVSRRLERISELLGADWQKPERASRSSWRCGSPGSARCWTAARSTPSRRSSPPPPDPPGPPDPSGPPGRRPGRLAQPGLGRAPAEHSHRVRGGGERHMPVPAAERASGEVPHPDLVGDLCEVPVDPVQQPSQPQQRRRLSLRQVGQPQLGGPTGVERADAEQQQLLAPAAPPRAARQPDRDPGHQTGLLGTRGGVVGPHHRAAQVAGRAHQLLRRAGLGAAATAARVGGDQRQSAPDPDQQRDVERPQPTHQQQRVGLPGVQHHRPHRQLPLRDHALEGRHRAVAQRLRLQALRDRRLAAPRLVVEPGLGQPQPPVDREAGVPRGGPDSDRVLGVEHLPERGDEPAVHPDRVLARLGDHHRPQHPGLRRSDPRQMLGQGPPYRAPVPGGAGDEVVQALLGRLPAHHRGDIPDRLAPLGPQQAAQVLDTLVALVAAGQ